MDTSTVTAKNSKASSDGSTSGGSAAPSKPSTFLPPPPKFDPSSVKTANVNSSSSHKKTMASLSSLSTVIPMKSLLDLDQLPKPPPLPLKLSRKKSSANSRKNSSGSSTSMSGSDVDKDVDVDMTPRKTNVQDTTVADTATVRVIETNSNPLEDKEKDDNGYGGGDDEDIGKSDEEEKVLEKTLGVEQKEEEESANDHDHDHGEHVEIPPLPSAPPSATNLQQLRRLQKEQEREVEARVLGSEWRSGPGKEGSKEEPKAQAQLRQQQHSQHSTTTLVTTESSDPAVTIATITTTNPSDSADMKPTSSTSSNAGTNIHVNPSSITMTEPPTLKIRKHPKRPIQSIIHPMTMQKRQSDNQNQNLRMSSSSEAPTASQLLTRAQTSIPILIVASNMAKEIVRKNHLEVEDLFNALSGSMFADHTGMLGKMSPLRSAGRMMNLKWDQMGLSFVSNFKGHSKGVHINADQDAGTNVEVEDRLGFCASVWEPYGEEGLASLEQQVEDLFHSHSDNDNDHARTSTDVIDLNAGPDRDGTDASSINEASAAALLSDAHVSPWYARFQHGVNVQTSYLPHSMMHCPPVVLYVATTCPCMGEGVDGLTSMVNRKENTLPYEYQNGLFDPDGMRAQFLLLHDEGEYKKNMMAMSSIGSGGSVASGLSDGMDLNDFNEGRALNEMRSRFGPGCAAVVRVNSNEILPSSSAASMSASASVGSGASVGASVGTSVGTDAGAHPDEEQEEEEEDPVFDAFIPPFSPSSFEELTSNMHKIRGTLLSARDKLSLRRFIAQMVTMVVIPAVERRIHELNVEVTNHKKGVKNVFKSFWRKPKDNNGGGGGGGGMSNSLHGMNNQSMHSNGGKSGVGNSAASAGGGGAGADVPYRYDTIESQTRLLADTLFLIRDYEGALGMYRIVRDDYKHDQNLLHNASAHEMMALCLCMTDASTGYRSTREIIQYIDSALYLYASAAEDDRLNSGGNRPVVASIATRCVTRLCLLLSATRMLCNGRDMETADSLAAASSKETPLGAAVLLEQASGHYYSAGMVRKFAFHMLMAGHMFRSAEQEHHAVRCFASAMHIYHGGARYWAELFNHLTSALAGQLYAMKRMQVSLQLYAKLVGTTGGGRVSVRSQQKFLDHLVTICRGYEKDALESVRRMKLVYYGGENGELDEAEGVLNSTPEAKRILEIPNMNLPKIFDTTLKVENTSVTHLVDNSNDDYATFGTPDEGSESVWQDLACCAQAELHVASKAKHLPVEQMSKKVIEDIEEERKKVSVAARMKKISSAADGPPSRAKLEPIAVSFVVSNPLSVMVPVSSMQLVAKLTCEKTHRVFTNIEAIDIDADDAEPKKTKKWKFAGSDKMFEVAHFARLSPTTDAHSDAWHSGTAEGIDPYFLVNKGKMAMDPGSKNAITLEICPLVMGELEIVGVRCKIFNEMWVYHKFKVLGPLLHNTAYNRANRVRGIPYLLRSNITSNMPSLSVDIIKKVKNEGDDVVLQGQISRWILRVSNQGAAPASNLCLKTNVPWFNIPDSDGAVLDEDEATSHCIGPSGTMMKLPLGKDDLLNSGQTLDIPVEIRTSGGGKQEFYMLFRYELFERSTASKRAAKTPKCRWLRKMVTVAVYPSLTVTASLMPSFKDKNDHILSVEMTNYRSDNDGDLEIFMNKICVASKNYLVKPMNHNEIQLQRETKKNGYSISWQEQITMHYLISPLPSSASQCTLSECVLCEIDKRKPDGSGSMIDFISLEHAHDKFMTSLEEHRKRIAMIEAEKEREGQHPRSIADIRRASSALSSNISEPEIPSNGIEKIYHPTSRACLCSPHDSSGAEINVICSWQTKGRTDSPDDLIVGQHHLRQLVVRPQHKSKRCPLLISSKFDSCVKHDFSVCPLNLDMEISIRNRLVQSKVDFEFTLDNCEDFDFIGTECFRKTLDGGEEVSFPLEAIIFQSGMYNLQCVKVTIFNSDGTHTPYVFPLQWMVQVNS